VCSSFYFRDGTGFLYYSYWYPMRLCSLSFYKGNEQKGIRNIYKKGAFSKIQRDRENGSAFGTHKWALSCLAGWIHCGLCLPCWYFSPEWQYEVSILVPCACHYSVDLDPYLGILSFRLPLFSPTYPTQSVFIRSSITDFRNSTIR
jgi:hypothetical protein